MTIANATNNAQFASINVVTFTSSGVYNPPQNLLWAQIELTGGGGGSGGVGSSPSNNATSGSGGSAGYVRKVYARTSLTPSVAVTVGAGGAGGPSGINPGAAGGASTFLGMTAGGGGGGASTGSAPTSAAEGGAGGTATGGDVNIDGYDGIDTNSVTTAGIIYASYPYSTPGQLAPGLKRNGATPGWGVAGSLYGGGACGQVSYSINPGPYAGYAGGAGIVIITEYLSQ